MGPRAPWEVIGNGDLFHRRIGRRRLRSRLLGSCFILFVFVQMRGCLNLSNYVEHETKETNYDSFNIVDN